MSEGMGTTYDFSLNLRFPKILGSSNSRLSLFVFGHATWYNMEEKKDKGNIFLPTEAIVLDMDPFLHCVIPNFIQSQDFLEGLQKELLSLDFHEKYNDLYKFQQVFIPVPLALPPQTVLGWKTIHDCCSSRGPRFRS